MDLRKLFFRVLVTMGFMAAFVVQSIWAEEEKGHARHAPHWAYEGTTGPDHWGEFFNTCGVGKSQSPIDIKGPFTDIKSAIKISYNKSKLKILNNGHTIQVNYDAGSSITIDNKKYDLLQFHFHRPSEERINGERKAMVAHFVHKSADGKLAVIGVLLDKGQENLLVKTIWENLPKEENKEQVKDIEIDASQLLPKNLAFYHFTGSLTTPPCTEGVSFYILKNTMQVSDQQVSSFPFTNARPTQPLNGRKIFESK
ncbi:MAG: carbonic anhydrase family protein [Spirochaetia bacterium]|nr:carbonic anhydrase family protein [Spirochaetia bacterium]